MPTRGSAALALVVCTVALPWALTTSLATALEIFSQPTLAANVRRSLMAGHESPAIMISGAACAISTAMLLSWRLSTRPWITRVLLALLIWIAIYARQLPSGSWTHGSPWSRTFERETTPWLGIFAGLASVGIHVAFPHAYHALIRWRHARRARPDQPVAQSTEEADA
ncbi:MAG: hypothetical protein K2X32_03800 [Phycisphaerales bacterium]|nr:hypothetical protein [Phycisphaerales bacterium]